jgi:putative ABC transport system permease protein
LSIKIERGHWLNNDDENEDGNENSNNTVVLNQQALANFPHAKVGDDITIGAAGNSRSLRIVGIAAQKMTSGTAYVSAATYQTITGQDNHYKNYRVAMKQHDDLFVAAATQKIEATLAQHQLRVNRTLTEARLRHEVDGHFTLLINALLFTALLMAVVGVIGLASVLSTQIAERTREFGIMRSIGASSFIIMRNIIVESVFIGVMSWAIAIVLSLPLTMATNAFLGELIFDEAFPLAISFTALWIWFLTLLAGTILASIYPANTAANISIRESLTR